MTTQHSCLTKTFPKLGKSASNRLTAVGGCTQILSIFARTVSTFVYKIRNFQINVRFDWRYSLLLRLSYPSSIRTLPHSSNINSIMVASESDKEMGTENLKDMEGW